MSCAASLVLLASLLSAPIAGANQPTGYAKAVAACAPPSPGYATCFALVRKQVAAASAEPGDAVAGVEPFVAGSGATSAGPAGGLTPADLASAYGYAPGAGGSGQTVGIVDAFDDPNIEGDLATFDSQYGLSACTASDGCLRKVGQSGGALAPSDQKGWSVETTLDVETVHAACPNCKILLVEANDNSLPDLAAATNEAVALGATEVSNSYGAPEGEFAASEQAAYNHPGVPIVASTGDDGYYGWDLVNFLGPGTGAEMPSAPASLPSVVSVGGTSLELNPDGTRARESVWNWNGPDDETPTKGATGGGCSHRFAAPPWQLAVQGFAASGCGDRRLDADVSAVGDPDTGLDIYDTYDCGAECKGLDEGWETIGGTSLSAPLISSLYALAGGGQGVSYPAVSLYGEAADASSRFDVTEGGNGLCGGAPVAECGHPDGTLGLVDCEGTTACNAAAGFDGPSGVGTPEGLGLFRPQPPLAAISSPASLGADSMGSFGVVGFSDPYPGGSLARASWGWGDGTSSSGTPATHSYASAGSYTVTLTVTDAYGVSSAPISTTVVVGGGGSVAGAPGVGPANAGATNGAQQTPASGVQQPPASGGLGTEGIQTSAPPASPHARLASHSLTVRRSGAVTVEITCSGTVGRCTGSVSLRSPAAASASDAGAASSSGKPIAALAEASFSIAAGRSATVTLHLSSGARALLAHSHSHTLHVTATVILRDPTGATHRTGATVVLRAAKPSRRTG